MIGEIIVDFGEGSGGVGWPLISITMTEISFDCYKEK